jgi:hypothetical protein
MIGVRETQAAAQGPVPEKGTDTQEMRTMMKKTLLTAAAAFLMAGAAVQPASAGIKCAGPNQVTNYGLIPSPYCEDVYLAKVAGYHPKAILYNPSAKSDACDAVGHDNRVAHICQGFGFRSDTGDDRR